METHGLPGRLHVTEHVEAALRGTYEFEDRGLVDMKGLGQMHTYFLVGRRADA